LNFLNRASKNSQTFEITKIPPVDLFHADRHTHRRTYGETVRQTWRS